MTLPQWRLPGASVAVRGVRGKLRAPGLNGGGSACTSRQSINARHGIGRSQSAELGPNLGPTPAIGHHGTLACDRAAATSTLAGDTQTDPADLGVKGSRVQMSPALPNTQRVTSRRSVR
jgi:hypothetical protein